MQPELLSAALVHIQSHLDEDLSLDAIAKRVGLSPHHFHREFRGQIGETVKQYTTRLRLERAAFQLLMHDVKVVDVAMENGFNNHETFSRQFRRHFGTSPVAYRKANRLPQALVSSDRSAPSLANDGFELSSTRPQEVVEVPLAFVRHVGPYESVDEAIFDRLIAAAQRRGLPRPYKLFGIGHDAPGITAPDQLRYDACLRLAEPIPGDDVIGCQILEARTFAVTTHVGPYTTLMAAYGVVLERLASWRRYEVVGLPIVEAYHTTRVDPARAINHTDLYVPIRLRG